MISMPIFQPQPLIAPLNAAGQQALADLLRSQKSSKILTDHFGKATSKLTAVAGQLNDRGMEEGQKYDKKRSRWAANGDEENEEERARYEDFRGKVEGLTAKMDKSIRVMIDDQAWAMSVPDILKYVVDRTGALAESTQRTSQTSNSRSTHNRRRQHQGRSDEDEDEDEEEEGDENDEADVQARESTPSLHIDPSDAPSALLRSALEKQTSEWSSKSLTERYAGTNEYTGFYRTIHDAKHPGEDALPVPHSSLWFVEEENRDTLPAERIRTGETQQAEDGEDSDLEIAGERISTKCPITFLTFKDPLTSAKCPHSFEKHAILDMLRHSPTSLPLTAEQNEELSRLPSNGAKSLRQREMRIPIVKCPVCDLPLTEADLRPDPVLVRKVKRLEAAATRKHNKTNDIDEDSESDEDELPERPPKRPVGLDSSPPRTVMSQRERIKMERARSMSIIPQTQLPQEDI